MATIHTAIKERRISMGISLQELARKISEIEGLTKPLAWQTVQQWEAGKSAPKRARMGATAKALGVNASALADGRVELEQSPQTVPALPVPAVQAQLTAEVGGTVNIHTLDVQPVSKMVAWEELCMPDLPNVFKLTLQDDSLAPKHQRGDFVELQRDLAPAAGDWVLVRIAHDEHTIRSFIDLGTEGWAAAPINKPGEAITSKSGASVVAVYIGGGVSGRMSSR